MDLCKRLNELLNKFGWTYYKLAKVSGVNRSNIEQLVKGTRKTTSHENLEKIAKAFNITVSELLSEKEPEIFNLEGAYVEVAKEAQDRKIDPEKLMTIIKLISDGDKK